MLFFYNFDLYFIIFISLVLLNLVDSDSFILFFEYVIKFKVPLLFILLFVIIILFDSCFIKIELYLYNKILKLF